MNLSHWNGKKIALVMSGGVVKAASWHLGVALALEELGLEISSKGHEPDSNTPKITTFVGSSAGAMVGAYFASGYHARNVINSTLGLKKERLRPVSYRDMLKLKLSQINRPPSGFSKPPKEMPSIVKTVLAPLSRINGFFTTEGLKRYLEEHVLQQNREFNDLSADFFIVGTQLDSSKKVVFSKYNYPSPKHDPNTFYYTGIPIADAAAASMSVPPFYSPYPLFNREKNQVEYYIDGEIRDTLSTHVAEDHKADVIISSWTHTPYHYSEEIGSLAQYGLPTICLQAIYLMVQKKIQADRNRRSMEKNVLRAVHDYLKEQKFSEAQRSDLLSVLESKFGSPSRSTLIDLYPDPKDSKLFFSNSFSLSQKGTSAAMKSGYRKTLEVFRSLKENSIAH